MNQPATPELPRWLSQFASTAAMIVFPGGILVESLKHMFVWVYIVRLGKSGVLDDTTITSTWAFRAAVVGCMLVLVLASRCRNSLKRATAATLLMGTVIALIVVWSAPGDWEIAGYDPLWQIRTSHSMEATLIVLSLALAPWLIADGIDRAFLRVERSRSHVWLRGAIRTLVWIVAAVSGTALLAAMQHIDSYGLAVDWGRHEIIMAAALGLALCVALLDHAAEKLPAGPKRIAAALAPNLLILVCLGGLILQQRAVTEGPFEEVGDDGILKSKGTRKAGKLHGPLFEYDSEGHLERETWYWEGLQHGLYKRWDDGALVEQGAYWFGQEVGEWRTWKDGEIASREVHQPRMNFRLPAPDGSPLGTERVNSPDMLHGRETVWFTNGQKYSEVPLLMGREHGTRRTWSEGGKLKEEANLLLGALHGEQKSYDEEGNLYSVEVKTAPEWIQQVADAVDPGWRNR